MSEEHGNRKEQDESITDALSTLGWIEESDEEEVPVDEEENLSEQLNFFIEQNKELNNEILNLKKQLDTLVSENENNIHEKEKLQSLTEKNNDTIENLLQSIVQKDDLVKDLEQEIEIFSQKAQDGELQIQNISQLEKSITTKNQENEDLSLQIQEKETMIQSQLKEIEKLNEVIENLKVNQDANKEILDQLQQKEEKVKELLTQIEYLEKDTIQKSKFEKLQLLVDKKDEILTEKEKNIFELQNTNEKSNQKIKELQSQLETFSLMKKDINKKEDRINELVLEIEKLTQKNNTNEEFLKRMEEKLEESQQKSGNITGKFELELANLRNINQDKSNEIQELVASQKKLKDKIYEAEQIEDRILTEMQRIKDDKLKLDSEIEKKDEEIIDLKKKIKLLRRDLKKS